MGGRKEEGDAPREQLLADAKVQADLMKEVASARKRLKQGANDAQKVRDLLKDLANATKAGPCRACHTPYLLDEPYCRQCGVQRREKFVEDYGERMASEEREQERKLIEAQRREREKP